MGEEFIQRLKEIVTKYPYPEVHKIIAYFILAMLKIRDRSDYMMQSMNMASLAGNRMDRSMRKLDDEIQSELKMEMFEITNVIMVFSDLTDEEVKTIAEYCRTIIPINNDSLEAFLSKHLNSVVIQGIPPSSNPFFNPIQAAMIETAIGFCDEKFLLRTENEVSNKEITQAIINFYEKMGFSVSSQEYGFHVCMKKNEELLNVVFSNDRDVKEIRVTVESIG